MRSQPRGSQNYQVPDPLHSHEHAVKFDHLDLTDMDDFTLWRETKRIEMALALPASRQELTWLLERLAAVRREGRARRRVA